MFLVWDLLQFFTKFLKRSQKRQLFYGRATIKSSGEIPILMTIMMYRKLEKNIFWSGILIFLKDAILPDYLDKV